MNRPFAITPRDIEEAADRIAGHVLRTPLVAAPRLSELIGAEVMVKHENMQATASFKERGAVNKLLLLTEDEQRSGVIAMSAGNHAQAVAYHARRFGIPATIVMPETTPLVKVENTRKQGARIVLHGETLYESTDKAREIAAAERLVLIHPYDDPAIMAGQGTVAIEMLAEAPDLDVLIIPVGGGGLMAGNAIAARAIRPDIELIGVEAELYPSFLNALDGQDRSIGGPTLADRPVIRGLVADIVPVSEELIERAVNAYTSLHHTLAEGAGAAGLAAILKEPARYAGRKVGLVLCGGNIDTRLLAGVMVRELERESRIVSLRLTSDDRPGLLGKVASLLGREGAKILEVSHSRRFLDVPAKVVSIEVMIETRGVEHSCAIEEALAQNGFVLLHLKP
ncbi:MAG: threonine ammonia-lyase [Pseudaminobacter sp.]|jgi:threonine dehydratase|uniref:Threonine dehydratase n=1 Tax=Aquamicrobium defluvii TaxID=69279 RepID=A0A011SSF7_9HYPH|nr:threonine ammonia-lyase [Aquamicrobium defluvii]EXL02114.1 threonine dehydratase [Aquamicrobium defluvii]EZQ12906.1 threonine dehydratase [Halopseudomonas bauzanensis]